MKCWIAVYEHRHGNGCWPIFREGGRAPTRASVVKTLDDWEGDRREDEDLFVEGPWDVPERKEPKLTKAERNILIDAAALVQAGEWPWPRKSPELLDQAIRKLQEMK